MIRFAFVVVAAGTVVTVLTVVTVVVVVVYVVLLLLLFVFGCYCFYRCCQYTVIVEDFIEKCQCFSPNGLPNHSHNYIVLSSSF